MATQSPLDYAEEHREQFLEDLKSLLRIPSISTLPEHEPDMERAAQWVRDRLQSIGIEAEIVEGDGHPLVYGEWLKAEGAPTFLLYGHYDVQPADPFELWTTPPFEPAVRNGNIYARGAVDDKGQTMTLIDAAESFMRTEGRLPVNLKFLIEGEEEAGGAVVTAFVKEHGDRLRADAAQIADTGMFAPGVPAIETGLRGNVAVEIFAKGASHDLHSGMYGGVAPNPLWALAYIIANLKDLNGRITIPHFYDDVVMPDTATRDAWRQLPFDEEHFLREEIGSTEMVGEAGYTALERTWARPTLDVHGIPGGFTGTGHKTVIPAEASAKITMRLVPDQRADGILAAVEQRVQELTPPGITLEIRGSGSNPVVVPGDSPFIRAAASALEATFGRPPVFTRSGGSIPVVGLLKEELGLDSVLMGFGLPDDNLHAPNEKMTIDNFYCGIDASIRFWQSLGRRG